MIDKKVEEYKNRKSTELYLNCCSYEDGNKKVIQGTNIKMEDSGLLYLCDRIMEINNLQVLNISCNGISSVRINEFFRLLKNITELKILDISDNNKIEDSGIEVLSSNLKHINHLILLDISSIFIMFNMMNRLWNNFKRNGFTFKVIK